MAFTYLMTNFRLLGSIVATKLGDLSNGTGSAGTKDRNELGNLGI